jgi:hypothetical protein
MARVMAPEAPDASRSDEAAGWNRTAQDAAEADDARRAADESPAPAPEISAQPFLERRIGYGNGRFFLIVIVLVIVFFVFLAVRNPSF